MDYSPLGLAVPSRRAFLTTASAAVIAARGASPLLTWATDSAIAIPGKDGLIVRSYRFLDLETPVELMTEWITPVKHFYVLNHMFEPPKPAVGAWALTINGELELTIRFTHAALAKIPFRSVSLTIDCSVHGR